MGYEEQYKQYVSDIETALQTAFPLKKITERCIYESARYSMLAGGQARPDRCCCWSLRPGLAAIKSGPCPMRSHWR